MLKQIIAHEASCDKCKKEFMNSSDFSIFTDIDRLMEELEESEWTNENGELLCFNCVTNYENEDSINDLPIEPLKIETDATGND